jgi:lipopolysaccharide/colanic/teichoic acid biosynthesis glycosyltransferase
MVTGSRPARLAIKRALDICLAASALVIGAPIMAIIAVLIRVSMGSPVLFRQQRPGLHGRPFEVVKFRTMLDRAGPSCRRPTA